jgi:low affinity Fe/Cu permease
MYVKTSIAVLLVVCSALLTGCNVEYGPDSRAVQVAVDKQGRQDNTPDKTTNAAAIAQLREDLRLANERARLAEEKAALEKQKREFAEERIRKIEEAGEAVDAEKSSVDERIRGS